MAEEHTPEGIQREIEETRAELAAAIDAIAERVSPRRVAVRGASRVREAVGSVLNNRASPDGDRPPVVGIPPGGGRELPPGTVTEYGRRVLRRDRVVIAGGVMVVAAAAVAVWLWRRQR